MRVLALTLVFAMEWTVTAAAQVTIVVDQGPFASVEVAARGEAEVNWDDADRADDTAHRVFRRGRTPALSPPDDRPCGGLQLRDGDPFLG